jgi:hypothetical protein
MIMIKQHTLSNFTNKTLERELADEQLGRLLVTTDFTKSDRSRPETMGLLDTSSDGGCLASLLGSELLTRGLATVKAELVKSPYVSSNNNIPSRFASGLLSASHLRI